MENEIPPKVSQIWKHNLNIIILPFTQYDLDV